MAQVGLGGEEEFDGDVGGGGRVVEEVIGLVVRADVGAVGAGCVACGCYVSVLCAHGGRGGR